MAVKLRLTRVGKKKQPHYRIVAADSRSPRDGRFIEILGHYNPRTDPSELTVDNDRAVKWLSDGAQPSERVRKLLEISGAWSQFKGGSADGAPPAASAPAPAAPVTEPAATNSPEPAASASDTSSDAE